MGRKMVLTALILASLCPLFLLYPEIDLAVSSLFYKGGFYLKDHPLALALYKATIWLTASIAVTLLFLLTVSLVTGREIVSRRVLLYLLSTLILGPGLIVNVGLKNQMGRARPSQTTYFGGSKSFTPALVVADQCERNCSFTSGHAAAAFYLLAWVPLFSGPRRWIVLAVALLWGWAVGIGRIVQGGHFLSDVFCSMVIDLLVAGGLYYLFFERRRDGALSGDTGHE
ncbi:MAG: phosphatase PAP2 family protein [Epsilonproteobacteria bacterium]|nr:hypothetical protein [Campylobacterota bacterium]NPA57068.1 phosphatase PAP2 family protein [Campylobacterota bacterium]